MHGTAMDVAALCLETAAARSDSAEGQGTRHAAVHPAIDGTEARLIRGETRPIVAPKPPWQPGRAGCTLPTGPGETYAGDPGSTPPGL